MSHIYGISEATLHGIPKLSRILEHTSIIYICRFYGAVGHLYISFNTTRIVHRQAQMKRSAK